MRPTYEAVGTLIYSQVRLQGAMQAWLQRMRSSAASPDDPGACLDQLALALATLPAAEHERLTFEAFIAACRRMNELTALFTAGSVHPIGDTALGALAEQLRALQSAVEASVSLHTRP